MKKNLISIVSIVLVLALVVGCVAAFAGCDTKPQGGDDSNTTKTLTKENIKIGLICLHGSYSTYDDNFIKAMTSVQTKLGLKNSQVIIAEDVPEGEDCYQKACDLADEGCDIIMADSFGHEDYMIRAAKKYPNVLFAHATGTQAQAENLDNFVNAFASIYEGRYLAGVVAGLKIQEMIDTGATVNGVKVTAETAKVGYVGAFTYEEVISGYTSWFLGIRSIVPSVTMDVTFTGSWYNEKFEGAAAQKLLGRGCILIGQHADSWGAPNACEDAGVPNVAYNVSTASACGNTYLVASRINWAPYYEYLIDCKINGTPVKKDYVGTIETGSVELLELGTAVAPGTAEKVAQVKAGLENGTIKVFDTSTFTYTYTTKDAEVTGPVETYKVNGTEVVIDGEFKESYVRSAPYFGLRITGINLLDEVYDPIEE